MLQHFVAEDEVKSGLGEGQGFTSGIDHKGYLLMSLGSSLEIVFQSHDLPGVGSQPGSIESYPTAIFQDTPLGAFLGGIQDHIQAPLLACPPNVRWLAAYGGFIVAGGVGLVYCNCHSSLKPNPRRLSIRRNQVVLKL
jgi:hypothetical protein